MFSARGGSFYSPALSPELQHEPFGAQEGGFAVAEGLQRSCTEALLQPAQTSPGGSDQAKVRGKLFLSLWTGGDQASQGE